MIIFTYLMQACAHYQGPVSDHFDGSRFYNQESGNTFFDHVQWLWQMQTVEWPAWIDDPVQPPPTAKIGTGKLRVTYINHATTLIQMDGINILTDPIWSSSAGPVSWLGVKRVRAPGVKLEDLPNIDVILLSHDHYDHLDFSTLENIFKKYHPIVLVGLGNKVRLESLDTGQITELDWWQAYTHSTGTRFIFVPSRHKSGRSLLDGNATLWGGFIIEGSSRVLFFGDTAFGEFLQDIKSKFPRFDLALLPIGSYEKRWFMKDEHMNPDDAVRTHKLLNVANSVGIHFGTFNEHPEQTIDAHEKDLAIALKKYKVPESNFWVLQFGEGRDVPTSRSP
ncbi:MAG: MBL fold metallo-hydrolase [Candidatus Competibacteraceae bacterium]